jgi:mRNA-degrading endonuclease RelE of RelBE toxin-antitoxin system
MSFEVLSIPPFDRQLKKLAKKYPSLKSEFLKLVVL